MDEKIKILCVDDEENVLRSLKRLFRNPDYEILTAVSGDEGLALLKDEDRIQIVISDFRMPEMNGVDFLKEVCEHWPDTVRIVLSGYADIPAIVGAINEGQIYKFMAKPWNDDELKVAISNALERYFMQQKNVRLAKELEAKNKELQDINDNLEKLVEEKTADLTMNNRILTCSHNILDSLPVGVVGIDPEGLIVQCNKKVSDILGKEEGYMLGMDRRDSFSEEINDFIEKVFEKRKLAGHIPANGTGSSVKGVHMEYSDGQEGIILTFDEETADER